MDRDGFSCPKCGAKVEVIYTGGEVVKDLDGVVAWDDNKLMKVRGRGVRLRCSADECHVVSALDEYLTESLVDMIVKESQKALDEFEDFLNEEE